MQVNNAKSIQGLKVYLGTLQKAAEYFREKFHNRCFARILNAPLSCLHQNLISLSIARVIERM